MSWDVLGRVSGGEGGIRTPDSLATMSDFETGLPYIVINHLADGWLLLEPVGIVFHLTVAREPSAPRALPPPYRIGSSVLNCTDKSS